MGSLTNPTLATDSDTLALARDTGFREALLDTHTGRLVQPRLRSTLKWAPLTYTLLTSQFTADRRSACPLRNALVSGFAKDQRFYTCDEVNRFVFLNAR